MSGCGGDHEQSRLGIYFTAAANPQYPSSNSSLSSGSAAVVIVKLNKYKSSTIVALQVLVVLSHPTLNTHGVLLNTHPPIPVCPQELSASVVVHWIITIVVQM